MISEGSCDTEDWSNDAENTHVAILHNITGFTVFLTSVNKVYMTFDLMSRSNMCRCLYV